MSNWISASGRLPEPFVSVLTYVPDEAPLPIVHEGYVNYDGEWRLVYCGYQDGVNVHSWMEMPEPPNE